MLVENNSEKNVFFICSTQYHIFNCINIAMNIDGKKDLIVLDFGNHVLDKFNNQRLSKVFNKIINLFLPDHNGSRWKEIIECLLSKKKFVFLKNIKCTDIFISATDIFSRIIAIKNWKKGVKVHYFEDGLASYNSILKKDFKYKQDLILKIFFGKRCLEICSDLYVYEPVLVQNNTYNIKILPISKKTALHQIEFIRSCFNEPVLEFRNDIIFLTAWFDNKDMYDEQLYYIRLIEDRYKNNL